MTPLRQHTREAAIATASVLLLLLLRMRATGFFSVGNLADLFLANLPVLLVSLGMLTVILAGEIDISVGSQFAVCSVVAGLLARAGAPTLVWLPAVCLVGAACGGVNGALTGYGRLPSIVVTLATGVVLRDGLRWATQGAWVGNLPAGFQRFGFSGSSYTLFALLLAIVFTVVAAATLRFLRAARVVYAVGSNRAAAQQLGIRTNRVLLSVFVVTGALTGLAAALNAVRFQQIPSNGGLGLELEVIAAVAVGGAAITGGSGTVAGTVLGVLLLGLIGPALTFLGVSAYWEKAIQGAIILLAVSATALGSMLRKRGATGGVVHAG